jgi:hypothetical protein
MDPADVSIACGLVREVARPAPDPVMPGDQVPFDRQTARSPGERQASPNLALSMPCPRAGPISSQVPAEKFALCRREPPLNRAGPFPRSFVAWAMSANALRRFTYLGYGDVP